MQFSLDIDECLTTDPCDHPNRICKNFEGSFSCECRTGYDGQMCEGTLILIHALL